jgi:hypothetical protein
MKVRLKFDWLDYGILHKCGSVVDVSDKDGASLVESGHEQVHQDTPSRINPDLYSLGCLPTQGKQSVFAKIALEIAGNEPENEGTMTNTQK